MSLVPLNFGEKQLKANKENIYSEICDFFNVILYSLLKTKLFLHVIVCSPYILSVTEFHKDLLVSVWTTFSKLQRSVH